MRQLSKTPSLLLITNRENQSLDKYLSEIAKVELITAEQEVELAKRIREGDQVALEKLAASTEIWRCCIRMLSNTRITGCHLAT